MNNITVINWRNMFDQGENEASMWLCKQSAADLLWMLKANDTYGNYEGFSKQQLDAAYWKAWNEKNKMFNDFTHQGIKFKARPVDATEIKEWIDEQELNGNDVEEVFRYRLWYYYKLRNDDHFHMEYMREHVSTETEYRMQRLIDKEL